MAKVLLVEDDEEVAHMVLDWLQGQLHVVDVIANGLEALELLLRSQYDVVVLDWGLPGISGIEILQSMRKHAIATPVLMLTGRSALAEKESGLDQGADDYLTKPFEMREFGARLRALLRRPAQVQTDRLELAGISLDSGNCTFKAGTEEVSLLPKEYAILEFLMRHPNQLFSADLLLNNVWKYDAESTDMAVRTCIARLRKKLASVGKAKLISTVYGMGYKLNA